MDGANHWKQQTLRNRDEEERAGGVEWMKVSVRDYREGLGVGSETCWSEKLIGSKPWQALEFRLCMSHFQSASLPNWLSNWRKQRTHYFVLVFRLFAAFFFSDFVFNTAPLFLSQFPLLFHFLSSCSSISPPSFFSLFFCRIFPAAPQSISVSVTKLNRWHF